MMRFVQAPVKVIGTGWVASAAALIFAAAEKENRFSLPNTRFLLHQPMGGARGQAADIAIEAEEILKMRRRLNETFARQTGQPVEKVEEDTDRNFWMSAKEAQEYGLVAQIVESIDDV
jgi:ATP-dependent Clp protease protease subunit